MRVRKDIPYAPHHGQRGLLDLFLPDQASNCPIVIVIHGGSLRALNKERMAGVSAFIAEQGWTAVNINYRLLPDNPFPAPLQDVLAAYRWILDTDQEDIRRQDRTRVALLGASAGGFLSMAAGLILGREQVRSIVSISGPARRGRSSDQTTSAELDPRLFSAPVELVNAESPPLLAVHSRNDELVKPEESVAIVERMREAGCQSELYLYNGPGQNHGIWRNDDPPVRFFQHLEDVIATFLRKTF